MTLCYWDVAVCIYLAATHSPLIIYTTALKLAQLAFVSTGCTARICTKAEWRGQSHVEQTWLFWFMGELKPNRRVGILLFCLKICFIYSIMHCLFLVKEQVCNCDVPSLNLTYTFVTYQPLSHVKIIKNKKMCCFVNETVVGINILIRKCSNTVVLYVYKCRWLLRLTLTQVFKNLRLHQLELNE